MSNDGMSALAAMFGGGRKVSEVVAEGPKFDLIPDETIVDAEIAGLKIETSGPGWKLNVAYCVTTEGYVGRFMYNNISHSGKEPLKIPTEAFDSDSRKDFPVVCAILDLLWEGYAINSTGKVMGFPEPNGVFLAATLGRSVKYKVRHTKYTKPGEEEKTYANPGSLFSVRKDDTVPCIQSEIPRLKNPNDKQQRISRRLENDTILYEIWKQIPTAFVVGYIEDRIKPMEAFPRGTHVLATVQSAKTTKSPKGADVLGVVWKVLKCSNENYIGRTIRESINVKMKPEKVANLFEATGLIQDDVLVLPAGLTPEEALVNRTAEFYTGVNEWQGREYTTVDTDYFPDNNLS